MKSEKVEVKSKGQLLEEATYEYPVDLKEAIKVDGEDNVYKLYAMQRKIRFMDQKRRALTGGGGLPKGIRDALKSADPAVLEQIQKLLGVDFGS
jgi:hypothetical protein